MSTERPRWMRRAEHDYDNRLHKIAETLRDQINSEFDSHRGDEQDALYKQIYHSIDRLLDGLEIKPKQNV